MFKRKHITLLLFILVLALAACGGSESEPTAEPATEAPQATLPPPVVATEEGSYLDSIEHVVDPNLVNKTWAWEGREQDGAVTIDVPDPENYTLLFNEDGTFNAKLDCNSGAGGYATSALGGGQGSIFMELGPVTLAECTLPTLSQEMVNMFGPAQTYEYAEDGAVVKFNWVAGGPVDTYRNVGQVDLPEPAEGAAVGVVTAPDGVFLRTGPGTHYPVVGAAPFEETGEIIGVSDNQLWWLANAPNMPGGQVWATAEWVEVSNAENVPVVAAPPAELTLWNVPWKWVSTTDPTGVQTVNDPSRYLVLFNEDGTAAIQADCNNVAATYTSDGSSISISTGASTMAACPPDSLDSQFLSQLSSVAIYFIEGGNLYMDMPADSGTMRFVPQGTPPPNPDSPAGEGDGQTFYLQSYGPEDAQQALANGTQITASFADDLITGNAGCNNYSGQLTPVNDYFTIGPIITTRQFCGAPAGVMEQEAAYLAALEAVGGYQWEQTLSPEGYLVTEGQLFYTMPDGSTGALTFSTSMQ